ncbi:MAG: MFS transporter [Microcella sp.]|uniref:MFS transporter n=1 Tax=Microcella sp. TaxID=1913979 RepID=UPI002725C2BE|nr:MFS transporter [Microcella sp.]MDO8338289.1 MFS transporter [Microcella sp.]
MPDRLLSPRGGRLLGVLGIVLIALNIRTAVAGLSPIAGRIGAEIPLDAAAIGLLGVVPPVAFAAAGIVAPWVAHRIGLERALLVAVVAMIAGHLLRGAATDYPGLLASTLVVLMGAGFGNILLPPAVKRYAPGRIGAVTAAYATMMSISTALPPLIAVPVADAAGWRVSLAMWGAVGVLALVPWVVLAARPPHPVVTEPVTIVEVDPSDAGPDADADAVDPVDEPDTRQFGRLARSRVVWGITIPFAISGVTAYSIFALMPLLLQDVAGLDAGRAGALLGLFAIVGLPLSLATPVITARLRSPAPIMVGSVAAFTVGFLGLALAPTLATPLWMILLGAGQILFPMCLTLIGVRSRTSRRAVTVSGFVQAIGYGVAAVAPLGLGLLRTATGSWMPAIVILLLAALSTLVAIPLLRSGELIDDEMERRGL